MGILDKCCVVSQVARQASTLHLIDLECDFKLH